MLVKVAQSCPTLCNPTNYTIHGILQARKLEWVAFPFSRGSSQTRSRTQVSLIAGGFFTSWATREAHKPTRKATTDFPGGWDGKVSAYSAGDLGSIPELGRSPGEGNGNPLQYSILKIPWTEEPGRPQSMGLQRHNWATSLTSRCWWEKPWRESWGLFVFSFIYFKLFIMEYFTFTEIQGNGIMNFYVPITQHQLLSTFYQSV